RLLALALDRWFLVVHATLHLLIQTALDHDLLERLQRRFDLIVRHLDLGSSQARHGSLIPALRRAVGSPLSPSLAARCPRAPARGFAFARGPPSGSYRAPQRGRPCRAGPAP